MSSEFIEFALAQRASLLRHAPSRTDEFAFLTWALLPFVLTMASVCGPLWPVR
ncbi:hypothetical protein A2U01_0111144, partial [Trifolium medium]|nr:hypothetical protein [Trifolium medium]